MDITMNQVSKWFDNQEVIKEYSVTLQEGKLYCLMGPSGIGKTTLINMLMGLIKPDQGNIQGLRGKKLSVVFQEDRLIEHWDAIHNVLLVCDSTVTASTVEEEFQKVDLKDYADKPVKDLSGGMRRRVAIVRAILAKGDLLIMDEPFKGLDEQLKELVIEYVKGNARDKTAIIVTHDKLEAELLEATRITLGL